MKIEKHTQLNGCENSYSSLVGKMLCIENFLWPKISIVMPSLNQGAFIEQSLLSILKQGYPNLQIIVVDGGSTDKTLAILEQYSARLSNVLIEKDDGQSDALNKGFELADGEIFGWLNSDDIYMPGAFFSAVAAFKKFPDSVLVFGDWLEIDRNNVVLNFNHAFDFNLNHFKYESFHLNSQSMFWKSELHSQFGGFDNNLFNTMDYQMILEFGLIAEKNFCRVGEIFGGFRRYEGQKTDGMTPRVVCEHKYLAKKYGYEDKYTKIGKLKRLVFCFRRAYWYVRRGGFKNLARRIRISRENAAE